MVSIDWDLNNKLEKSKKYLKHEIESMNQEFEFLAGVNSTVFSEQVSFASSLKAQYFELEEKLKNMEFHNKELNRIVDKLQERVDDYPNKSSMKKTRLLSMAKRKLTEIEYGLDSMSKEIWELPGGYQREMERLADFLNRVKKLKSTSESESDLFISDLQGFLREATKSAADPATAFFFVLYDNSLLCNEKLFEAGRYYVADLADLKGITQELVDNEMGMASTTPQIYWRQAMINLEELYEFRCNRYQKFNKATFL